MGAASLPLRARARTRALHRPRPMTVLVLSLSLLAAVLWLFPAILVVLHDFCTLVSLPVTWSRNADAFLIRPDEFDLTFASYDAGQMSAGDGFPDRVPPVLHHIVLGGERAALAAHDKWSAVRQSCLDVHPGWEAHLWTDDKAEAFVAGHFPELKDMWDSYQYPIQKIDALRYMVLYEYGGVILDMDLRCKRALGPLRRFDYVSPAAHPQGFSIGFMMASKHNNFVGQMVGNLKRFNRHWLGLPYPTVMFSTGCHYASTIHASQPNRTDMKILRGPPDNPMLHSLNGPVSTPIFDHLGSSSWHSFDANLIVSIGKHGSQWKIVALLAVSSIATFLVVRRLRRRRWGRLGGSASPPRLLSPVRGAGENLKL